MPFSLHITQLNWQHFSSKLLRNFMKLNHLNSNTHTLRKTHTGTHFLTCTAHRKSRRSLRSSCLEWRARALTKSNRDRMGSKPRIWKDPPLWKRPAHRSALSWTTQKTTHEERMGPPLRQRRVKK